MTAQVRDRREEEEEGGKKERGQEKREIGRRRMEDGGGRKTNEAIQGLKGQGNSQGRHRRGETTKMQNAGADGSNGFVQV